MLFAINSPNFNEINPATTIKTTFINATIHSPSFSRLLVSYSNVENVVYAPKNPTVRNNLHCKFTINLSANRDIISPIKKLLLILTTNVPNGKLFPQFCPIHKPMVYLATAPKKPPAPIIRIFSVANYIKNRSFLRFINAYTINSAKFLLYNLL